MYSKQKESRLFKFHYDTITTSLCLGFILHLIPMKVKNYLFQLLKTNSVL